MQSDFLKAIPLELVWIVKLELHEERDVIVAVGLRQRAAVAATHVQQLREEEARQVDVVGERGARRDELDDAVTVRVEQRPARRQVLLLPLPQQLVEAVPDAHIHSLKPVVAALPHIALGDGSYSKNAARHTHANLDVFRFYLCFLKTLKVWSLGKFSLLSVSAWKDTLPIGDDDDSDVTYKQHDDSVW